MSLSSRAFCARDRRAYRVCASWLHCSCRRRRCLRTASMPGTWAPVPVNLPEPPPPLLPSRALEDEPWFGGAASSSPRLMAWWWWCVLSFPLSYSLSLTPAWPVRSWLLLLPCRLCASGKIGPPLCDPRELEHATACRYLLRHIQKRGRLSAVCRRRDDGFSRVRALPRRRIERKFS